MGNIMKEVK